LLVSIKNDRGLTQLLHDELTGAMFGVTAVQIGINAALVSAGQSTEIYGQLLHSGV